MAAGHEIERKFLVAAIPGQQDDVCVRHAAAVAAKPRHPVAGAFPQVRQAAAHVALPKTVILIW